MSGRVGFKIVGFLSGRVKIFTVGSVRVEFSTKLQPYKPDYSEPDPTGRVGLGSGRVAGLYLEKVETAKYFYANLIYPNLN